MVSGGIFNWCGGEDRASRLRPSVNSSGVAGSEKLGCTVLVSLLSQGREEVATMLGGWCEKEFAKEYSEVGDTLWEATGLLPLGFVDNLLSVVAPSMLE